MNRTQVEALLKDVGFTQSKVEGCADLWEARNVSATACFTRDSTHLLLTHCQSEVGGQMASSTTIHIPMSADFTFHGVWQRINALTRATAEATK